MKRKLLFILATLFLTLNTQFSTLSSQQLPNSSFENWEHDALNNYEDGKRPVGWNTSNIKKTVVGITAGANMVFPDGGAHSGTYCAKAINTEVGAAGITETSPAWFTLGKPWSYIDGINTGSATAGTDGGIEFTYRPDTVAVWIKRTASGNENAHIVFYSWKGTSRGDSYKNKNNGCSGTTHYDEESDIRQTTDANDCGTAVYATQIAEAMWRSKETFSEWTEVKIPIKYLSNDKPEKCNVIISAANYPNFRASHVELNAAIWADDFRLIYSSGIDEIYVDGRKKLSCKSGQLDYTCSLGKSATEVGEITLKRSGRWLDASEYTIKKGAIGGVTSIVVKAEDGSSVSTYNITFAAAMSSNPNLGDILLDGVSLVGFNGLITSYNVELPFGSVAYPVVEAVLAEDGQQAKISVPSTFPGTVKISTVAPDAITKKEYSITFTVGALTDNTLTDIRLNGKTIQGFNPTKNNYTVELPLGTTEVPKLEYTTAYPNDHDIVVDNKGISGGIEIKVTPKGTTNTRTYKIKFVVTESTYSKLAAIMIDGKLIDGFNPELLTYTINLPIGTTELPSISFEKGDNYQTVTVENGGFDAPTKITVKSQSGAQSIYRINFVIAQSSISTLKDISLDGQTIVGFNPEKTSYNVELPQGTTVAPKITFVKGDDYQTVTLTEGGLNGVTRIVVKAQSGAVTTYTIEFTIIKSANSKLSAIMLDGILIEGFASDITSYSITLPRGTTKLPEISWTPGDASQTIRIADGGVNGETKITVKAQTGDVTVYSIFFKVETNSNVNLRDIKVGGVSIPNFNSETLDYSFVLPAGTTMLPEISYVKDDEAQNVSVTRGGVNGVTQILVKAEDGTTRLYTITFSVLKSENAFLEMIYIDGVPLADFDKEKFDYQYILTSAVTECPEVTVDKVEGQNISISVPLVTGTVSIVVTPESGSKNVYTIDINYPQSDNSKLAKILVDGDEIAGWDAMNTDYALQIKDNRIPIVTYVKGEEKQSVIVESNSITGDTKFIVKAENGDVTIYSVTFERVKSSVATLNDIKVGGVSLFGQQIANTQQVKEYEYNYLLSRDMTQCPEITYVKGDEKQNVTLIAPALEGEAKLVVVSEDALNTITYTINFSFELSSNTDLQEIILGQRVVNYTDTFNISDFELNDTITIDWVDGVDAPTITYVTAEEQQIVALADGGLNGSELLVIAEDGSERKYVIRYNIQKSNIAQLADLQLYDVKNHEFVKIHGFERGVYEYNIVLPWRTKDVPVLNPVMLMANQSVEIIYGGVEGATRIIVTAQDGVTKQEYIINFSTIKSSVATLSAIYYNLNNNSQEVSAFNPEKFDYVIELPNGTTQAPILTWDLGEFEGKYITEQVVEYTAKNLYEPSTIKVKAEDGTERVYTIQFTVAESVKPNKLEMISVGNTKVRLIEDVYSYVVELPFGTTVLPAITIQKMYPEQNVVITSADLLGTTKIEVYPNRGEEEVVVYTLKYEISKVSPASLSSVEIDGANVRNFDSGETTYVLEVSKAPTNIKPLPIDGAQWELDPSSNSDRAIIHVTGDDGNDEKTYYLYFRYPGATLSNNNRLSTIKINGVDLSGFNSDVLEYTYNVEAENRLLPKIEVVGEVETQQHRIVWSETADKKRVAAITVTALDGSTRTYKIVLDKAASTNRLLNGLKVNGELLDGFDANILQYTYNVSNLTRKIPDIEIIGANYNQIIACTIDESSVIVTVRAENVALVNFYRIDFVEEKDDVVTLNNISLNDYTLAFDATISTYNVNLTDEFIPTLYFEKKSEGQIVNVVIDNNAAKLNVTAQNGTSKGVYTINFVRTDVVSKAQLATIYFNDYNLLDGSATDIYDYKFNVDEEPLKSIYYEKLVVTDVVTQIITPDSVLLKVKSADAFVENIYRIIYDVTLSKDATLESLTYDYRPIEGFTPALTDYPIEVARGEYPHVTAKTFDKGTTIKVSYLVNDKDERVFLFDTESEDKTKMSTSVRMNRPKETSTALGGIFFNGVAMRENGDVYTSSSVYMPDVKEYNIKLHSASPKMEQPVMPNITAVAGEYGQTIVIENGGIDGDTYITVISESGDESDYVLKFAPELSSNVTLNDLRLNYKTIENFQSKRYFYNVKLPKGVDMPIVSWQAADAFQSIDVREYENKIEVVVTAEDGTSETYQIDIEWLPSNETNIESILSNGQPLVGFDPTIYDYFFDLPVGTMVEPMLKIVAGAEGQSISIVPGGVNGTTVISVTAPDGVTKRDYRIHYNLLMSENNKLNMIYLDGEALTEFTPDLRDYTIVVPFEKDYPFVTWENGDEYQTVTRTIREDGTVILKVEPQRAELYYEYIVRFEKVMSKDATLKSIEIDGAVIEGFSPDKFTYLVNLPIGTEVVPYISYTPAEETQIVHYIEPATINDVATIKVVAQDATYSNTYYVAFNRLLSDVDTLRAILIDGVPVESFDANTMEYIFILPYGTEELPDVSYEAGDNYQTIDIIKDNLGYIIGVTAESGIRRTYMIKFEIEKSSNSLLKAINANGVLLSDFDAEVFEYEIVLPYGTTTPSVLTYELAEMNQTIKYQPAVNVTDTAIFEVTAENGIDKSVYRVYFKVVKSDNALLANIFIGEEPLTTYARSFEADKSFSSDEFIYNIIFPYGTEVLPEIKWEGVVDDYASVVVSGDSVRGKTIITVTSADGYNVSDYELNFDVRKSDNAYLKSLSIKDVEFDVEFDSTIFEYVVTFPIGTDTLSLPTIDDVVYEQILPTQNVVVSQNTPTELVVLVTAEDGIAMNAYQIKFEISLSNNTLLNDLKVAGVSIDNFSPTHYEYTYMLFHGDIIPKIEFEKGEESQQVDITYGNINEPTIVFVEAEDGSLGTYVINFVETSRNPGDKPSFDDVAWVSMGDGCFKASSLRDNVQVMIYTSDGTRMLTEKVGLVNPNEDIRLPHSSGTYIYLPNNRNIYIYTFVYDNKVIASGKFVR